MLFVGFVGDEHAECRFVLRQVHGEPLDEEIEHRRLLRARRHHDCSREGKGLKGAGFPHQRYRFVGTRRLSSSCQLRTTWISRELVPTSFIVAGAAMRKRLPSGMMS
jgi:hypothetical protein